MSYALPDAEWFRGAAGPKMTVYSARREADFVMSSPISV